MANWEPPPPPQLPNLKMGTTLNFVDLDFVWLPDSDALNQKYEAEYQ